MRCRCSISTERGRIWKKRGCNRPSVAPPASSGRLSKRRMTLLMKLAIHSGKPPVDSRRRASSSSLPKCGAPLTSVPFAARASHEIVGSPLPLGKPSDNSDNGDLESMSADRVWAGDVRSPNLMYCEISMRKVVVQSFAEGKISRGFKDSHKRGSQSSTGRSRRTY